MNKPIEEIQLLLSQRKKAQGPWLSEAFMLRDLVNGSIKPPGPEEEQNEYAAVANIARRGLEQTALRVASTQPDPKFPALRPGIQKSENLARLRRLAIQNFWHENDMEMLDSKRALWYLGYGRAPVQITPSKDPDRPIPMWRLRDPMTTFPAPTQEQDSYRPCDVIFTYCQTYYWLQTYYPQAGAQVEAIYRGKNKQLKGDILFDIAEYVDEDERVLCILGERQTGLDWHNPYVADGPLLELERVPNRAGICPVSIPSLINLDRPRSSYADSIGMFIMRNKLMALEYLNAKRNVFSDRYFLEETADADVINTADGVRGIMGRARGGKIIDLQQNPNFQAGQIQDRLERAERVDTGTIAEMSGESTTNIRTGKRGMDVQSTAIDFTIKQAQHSFETAKQYEIQIAARIEKAYHNQPKSFYFGLGKADSGKIDYKPSDIWETDRAFVAYSMAGADINALAVAGLQRVSAGTMSKLNFARIDPMIEDPELEFDQIISEQIDQSILQEFLQPGGPLNPVDKARVAILVRSDETSLADAILKVNDEAQKRQASVDEQGNPTGVDPNSPAAQPGVTAPGTGEEAGEQVAPPTGDLTRLSQLFRTIAAPNRASGIRPGPVTSG